VSIARAIVGDPDLILADEPTGNLDAASAQGALRLLEKLNKDFGKTIVMVNPRPARRTLRRQDSISRQRRITAGGRSA
jgi:putative ABC transport system ATP-binding protein